MSEKVFENRRKLARICLEVMHGNAFQFATEPTQALFRIILSWIMKGARGGMVTGLPRLGKTCAVKWCVKALGKYYGTSIPHLHVPMRSQDRPGEKDFFQHILVIAKHQDALQGTAYNKRDRLTTHLMVRARRSPLRLLIISFDEAQTFQQIHWDWILNIGNEAVENEVLVFFLFIGQPELLARKQDLIDKSQGQIVDRYLSQEAVFEGITSLPDFTTCLQGYDTVVHPAREKLPLISHFVSDPSFSLIQFAEAMWKAFEEIWLEKRSDPSEAMVLPMHHIASAVTTFLTLLSNAADDTLASASNHAHEAVKQSGYAEFVLTKNQMGMVIEQKNNNKNSK